MSWATHKIRQENKEACPPGCYYCVEGGVSGAVYVGPDTYKQLINDYKEANGLPLNRIDKPTRMRNGTNTEQSRQN